MGADEGRLRVVVAVVPVAGVQAVIVQEYGLRWEILAALINFSAGLAAANRYLQVAVTMGAVTIHVMASNLAVIAGASRRMNFGCGVGDSFTGGGIDDAGIMPVGLTVNGQAGVATNVVNIQLADQINGFILLVREWLEPQ